MSQHVFFLCFCFCLFLFVCFCFILIFCFVPFFFVFVFVFFFFVFCFVLFLTASFFFFYYKFYFKNVNIFMFSWFEPNFIEKFYWKSGFSNFGHVTIFAKRKFFFWPPFGNDTFFNVLFADVYLFLYTDMVQVLYRNFTGKNLKMVGSKWTPCAQTVVKNSLGT